MSGPFQFVRLRWVLGFRCGVLPACFLDVVARWGAFCLASRSVAPQSFSCGRVPSWCRLPIVSFSYADQGPLAAVRLLRVPLLSRFTLALFGSLCLSSGPPARCAIPRSSRCSPYATCLPAPLCSLSLDPSPYFRARIFGFCPFSRSSLPCGYGVAFPSALGAPIDAFCL